MSHFQYPLKASENFWFSDVSRGCRKRIASWSGVIFIHFDNLMKNSKLYFWEVIISDFKGMLLSKIFMIKISFKIFFFYALSKRRIQVFENESIVSNQSVQFSVSNQSVSLSRVLMEISSLVFYAFWLDICYKCQKLIQPNFVKFKSPNFCQYLNLKYGLYQFLKKFIILLVLKRAK